MRRGIIGGFVFIALGVMLLLEALDLYSLAPSTTWPILLVALGVGMLAGIGDDETDNL